MIVRDGFKLTEVGLLPEDWSCTTVGDQFSVQLGKMLDAAKNSGVMKPYVGNSAVQWGQITAEHLPMMAMSESDLRKFRLVDGDLLVCEGGEVGRAAIWRAPVAECYFQKALHRLRPSQGYSQRLLLALLEYYSKSDALAAYVTQTSIAHLPREKFVILPIPLPPLPEQRAIAAALSDVDALLESIDRVIAKKRAIKQATMQQLLTGRTRLPGFSGEWEVKRLGEVVQFGKGRGLPKSSLREDGSEPCVHYGELFTQYGAAITAAVSRTDDSTATSRSLAGDVLMPTSDVTPRGLAKASCILSGGVILGSDILVLRPETSMLCGTFLSYLIRFDENQVLALVTGTTVFHIYASEMAKFSVRLPPLPEQRAIAAVLSDMDAELEALQARRHKTQQVKQGMMQELLTGRTRLV